MNLAFSFATTIFAMPFALVLAAFLFAGIESSQHKGAPGSSFVMGILHVLTVRTHPKMFRIYAAWIVARVADAFTFRNWAFKFLKDNPVCEARSVAFVFPRNLPIAFAIQGTLVIPAAGQEIDFNLQEDSLPRQKGFDDS
jgi:hypothetical protein